MNKQTKSCLAYHGAEKRKLLPKTITTAVVWLCSQLSLPGGPHHLCALVRRKQKPLCGTNKSQKVVKKVKRRQTFANFVPLSLPQLLHNERACEVRLPREMERDLLLSTGKKEEKRKRRENEMFEKERERERERPCRDLPTNRRSISDVPCLMSSGSSSDGGGLVW